MDIELYCCYSLPLRNFLYRNGLKYKFFVLEPINKIPFWLYVKDDKLNELLHKWSKLK